MKNLYEELELDGVSEPQFMNYIFDLLYVPFTADDSIVPMIFGDPKEKCFTNLLISQCWESHLDDSWKKRNKKAKNKMFKPISRYL